MKIAICFSGLLRNFKQIYMYIKKNIIEPNQHHELHIFACTSLFDEKKDRFKPIKKKILNPQKIEDILKSKFGNLLKDFYIYDDQKVIKQIKKDYCKRNDKHYSRFHKIYKVLKLKSDYEQTHNFKYDLVVFHRFDVIFTDWNIANLYYEDKVVGEKRIVGNLVQKNNINIGVENHGCCCIKNYPPIDDVNTIIKLNYQLNDNQIICYEDYFIGHVFQDFFISNSYVSDKFRDFYNQIKISEYFDINLIYKPDINVSLQTYEKHTEWYKYSHHLNNNLDDIKKSIEYQVKYFLINHNINDISELRLNNDIAVLYLR